MNPLIDHNNFKNAYLRCIENKFIHVFDRPRIASFGSSYFKNRYNDRRVGYKMRVYVQTTSGHNKIFNFWTKNQCFVKMTDQGRACDIFK